MGSETTSPSKPESAPEAIPDEALDMVAGGTLRSGYIGETEKNLGINIGKKDGSTLGSLTDPAGS